MLQGNEACGPQPLSLCSRACRPQRLKPMHPRSSPAQPGKPPHREARTPQPESGPYLPQPEKAHVQPWRPGTAQSKYVNNKSKEDSSKS